jgi:hypothetical protein
MTILEFLITRKETNATLKADCTVPISAIVSEGINVYGS